MGFDYYGSSISFILIYVSIKMFIKEQNKIQSHNNNENVSNTQLFAGSYKEFPLNAVEMGPHLEKVLWNSLLK